ILPRAPDPRPYSATPPTNGSRCASAGEAQARAPRHIVNACFAPLARLRRERGSAFERHANEVHRLPGRGGELSLGGLERTEVRELTRSHAVELVGGAEARQLEQLFEACLVRLAVDRVRLELFEAGRHQSGDVARGAGVDHVAAGEVLDVAA